MTLTLSTTFLGTDVFQFLRKRKEGRRRKRLFPRTAVEWMVWGWGQSHRACRGLWALHHALWPSGPLPQCWHRRVSFAHLPVLCFTWACQSKRAQL